MTIKEIIESWIRVTNNIKKSIQYSELIVKSFSEGYVSHYEVAPLIRIHPDKLALEIINTEWSGTILKDGGIGVHTMLLHKLMLHYIPLYVDVSHMGDEGILIYKDPLLNKHLGYRDTPSVTLDNLKGKQFN